MSVESELVAVLRTACPRVFADIATVPPERPYVIWQGIGGPATRYVDNQAADKRRVRVTITSWAESREAANALAQDIEARLASATSIVGAPEAEAAAIVEPDNVPILYGAQQDFLIVGAR